MEAALRWTLVLHLDSLNAAPILQLKVTHHHGVDAHWVFLTVSGGAWRVVHRLVLLVHVVDGV